MAVLVARKVARELIDALRSEEARDWDEPYHVA